MGTYTDRGLPKARKQYPCYVCGGVIEKGQNYGREGLLRSHFECPTKPISTHPLPAGEKGGA